MNSHRIRCDIDGRFIAEAHAASWNWFAYEAAAFCPAHERGLPTGYAERQQALRELTTGGGR